MPSPEQMPRSPSSAEVTKSDSRKPMAQDSSAGAATTSFLNRISDHWNSKTAHYTLLASLAGGALVLVFFVAIFFSLGGSNLGAQNVLPNIEVDRGDVFVENPFTGAEDQIASSQNLSGQNLITTAAGGEATIRIPGKAEIRLSEDTQISVDTENAVPFVEVREGDVWIFAPEQVQVETAHYSFTVAAGSARFVSVDSRTRVKAWNNSLLAAIKNVEGLEITLPMLTESLFPEASDAMLAPDTLRELRFSKILKEFQVHPATADARDTGQRKQDALLLSSWGEEILARQRNQKGFFEELKQYATFFSQKKSERLEKTWQEKKRTLALALNEKDAGAVATFFADEIFTVSQLRELLREIIIFQQNIPVPKTRQLAEDRLLSILSPGDRSEFWQEMLRNAFGALQQAFLNENTDWQQKELARITAIWEGQKNNLRTEKFLTLDRENIFQLALQNTNQFRSEVIALMETLDQQALKVAQLNDRETTRLEIAQKRLILANRLANGGNTALARTVLQSATDFLTPALAPENQIALANLQAQYQGVDRQLSVCEAFGACTNRDFQDWISRKKLIVCQTETRCTDAEFTAWLNDLLDGNMQASAPEIDLGDLEFGETFGDPAARAREILESADIVLEDGEKDSDPEFFHIKQATTVNGFRFSGRLSLRYSYLQEVKLSDGTEFSGLIGAADLEKSFIRALYPEGNPFTDIDTPPIEDQNTPALSPVVAELVIRSIQPELLNAGLITLREDIAPVSSTRGFVQKAVVGEQKIEVSFSYVIDKESSTAVVKNLHFAAYPELELAELTLSSAAEIIVRTAAAFELSAELTQKATGILERAGFAVNTADLQPAVGTPNVAFSRLYDPVHELTFSGVLDTATSVFLSLTNLEQKWSVENIAVSQYASLVTSPQPTENPFSDLNGSAESGLFDSLLANISAAPESGTANTISALQEVQQIFQNAGAVFSDKNFETLPGSSVVIFQDVPIPAYEVTISGEYSANSKRFRRISGNGVETKEDITLDEFLNSL